MQIKKAASGVPFIYCFTATLSFYYILKTVFPDIFIGGNIVENNVNAVYAQATMALVGILAYGYIIANWYFIKTHVNLLFLLRIVLLYIVYWIIRYAFLKFSISDVGELLKETCAILYFYVFYVMFHKDYKRTRMCIIILVPIILFQFFWQMHISVMYTQMMHIDTEMDSNSGAAFAAALVIPLCIKRNNYAVLFYMLLFVLVLYCGQRSGILTAALSLPFAYNSYRKQIGKGYIPVIIAISAIVAVPYMIKSYDNIMERTQKEQEKGSYGSGRSEIYPMVLNSYCQGNPEEVVFGRPREELKYLIGRKSGAFIVSHNGWLDMLYIYGMLGMSIYVSVFVLLIRRRSYIKKYAPQFYGLYIYMILYWLVKNTVTHGNLGITFIPFSIAWAYMFYIANTNQEKIVAQ